MKSGTAIRKQAPTIVHGPDQDGKRPGVGAGVVPFGIRIGAGQLAFSQDWGPWGYLGAAEAQQAVFLTTPGSALSQLGVDFQPTDPGTLPQAGG